MRNQHNRKATIDGIDYSRGGFHGQNDILRIKTSKVVEIGQENQAIKDIFEKALELYKSEEVQAFIQKEISNNVARFMQTFVHTWEDESPSNQGINNYISCHFFSAVIGDFVDVRRETKYLPENVQAFLDCLFELREVIRTEAKRIIADPQNTPETPLERYSPAPTGHRQ